MSDIVIRVENLSKHYRLGTIGGGTLREDLNRAWAKLRGRADPNAIGGGGTSPNDLWALRGVSFEVRQGEVLGIIGRNGAGKSTLLKILSRTTAPTTGRALIRGRIGSLLEVGTGFHPELTGRENIYLNGSILGMGKAEITKKLEEIIDFSGVERFIDTPVKRYSSGMYVRLAFAVAAHLEPEILIVDEVLAVGDAGFQRKCIEKMQSVARSGSTVLFVTHNIGVIASLCRQALLLKQGATVMQGEVSEAIRGYLEEEALAVPGDSGDLTSHPNRLPGMTPALKRLTLTGIDCKVRQDYLQSETVRLFVSYDASADDRPLAGCGFIIRSASGVRVGGFNSYMASPPPHKLPLAGEAVFRIPLAQFTPGTYYLTCSIGSHQGALVDKVEDALVIEVHPADIYNTGYVLTSEDGVSALRCTFESKPSA
jgi:lipopolysaccharide transport system ATP-binding protein